MLAEAAPARDPAAFARSFSLEATRPNAAEIEALAGLLPAGTLVYLPAVPTVATRELVAAAAALRKAGLEPVAHIAARRLSNAEQLNDLLAGLRSEADMRRLLVIGGDVDKSGPFAEALAVIQKGRLREAGIEEIGGAGESRHGRPCQCDGAAALCQTLRRQCLAARVDVGGGGRADRPCRSRTHDRRIGGGRRHRRSQPALFFIRRGLADRPLRVRCGGGTAPGRSCYGSAQ